MCESWTFTQHPVYQVANVMFFMAYSVPDTKTGVLVKHTLFVFGFLCYSLWGWSALCSTLLTTWNAATALINVGQILHIVYHHYPRRFQHQLEDVYSLLFRPHKVARTQFGRLVSPEMSSTLSLAPGDVYASAGCTQTERLALLLTGECEVMSGQRTLHQVTAGQFLDSPEFVSTKSHKEDMFRVNIQAVTECRLLVWQRTSLETLLAKDAHLAFIFANIISRDIASKLQIIAELDSKSDGGTTTDLRLLALKFSENNIYQKTS